MQKGLFRKGLVFGIIFLFVGASVLPSTFGTTKEKMFITKIGNRGYIQDLIDNASDGDTIYIPSGIYYEIIVIYKSISLVGEDKNTTIIDGGFSGTVVYISAEWVNISGFTIQDGVHGWAPPYCGIRISSNYNTISGNIITNNEYGIFLIGNNNIIVSNTIQGFYDGGDSGIYTTGCNNIISGNTITKFNRGGIGIYGDNNTISGNIITNNGIPNSEGGISLEGNSNTITGNTIANNEFGISLSGYNNTITNNNITNNHMGLGSSSCDNIISNNSFFNTGLVISDDTVCNNIIMNNTVNKKPLVYLYNESDLVLDGDAGQIILINCINITLRNQEIFNTTVGIQILGSNNCVISGNTITNNREGMNLFGDSNTNTISGNMITNSTNVGICLGGENNTISDNTITNNEEGITLDSDGYYNNIINNIINNNGHGISLFPIGYTAYNNIINNTIANNSFGIIASRSDYNIISGNNIIDNYYSGIFLQTCDFTTIVENTIIKNGNGISLYDYGDGDSGYNIISDNTITYNNGSGIIKTGYESDISDCNYFINNTISNNRYGIKIYGKDNNIIGNTIKNNTEYGIVLYDYKPNYNENNIFYHNNLINNGQNAYSEAWDNTWYNKSFHEGNYWSDYTGNDTNGDGFGDTPYDIPGYGYNKDLYPFMEPNGWLKEPDFQKTFIFGKIRHLVKTENFIVFEAVMTRVIAIKPFSFHKYVSHEVCIITLDYGYLGLIGKRYVFALCESIIRP